MGRRTETKTEPRSEGDAERAFRAQQTQPFSSTTVADRVSSPLLVSSRSSRRLSRVSHAQREQSLWSLASIDDGARDPKAQYMPALGEGRRLSRLVTRRSSVDRSPGGAALKAFWTSARRGGIPPSVPARAYGDGRHGTPPARHRGVGG
jgi:hypothetical protein